MNDILTDLSIESLARANETNLYASLFDTMTHLIIINGPPGVGKTIIRDKRRVPLAHKKTALTFACRVIYN